MALLHRKNCAAVATYPIGINFILVGTTLALLVLSCSTDCCGKSFHPVTGQLEVEEDTSQGNLKDQFPQDLENLEDVDRPGNNDVWPGDSVSRQVYLSPPRDLHNYQRYRSPEMRIANSVDNTGLSNYAYPDQFEMDAGGSELHKRSQVPGMSPYSASLEDEAKPYPSQPQVSSETSPDINSSEKGFRIRQKILNLRNQYGDKWLALVGPYAYRKRQILYRQCFFNPISCF